MENKVSWVKAFFPIKWKFNHSQLLQRGGDYLFFCLRLIRSLRKLPPFSLILEQLYEIGAASFPVVALTGLFTGLVLSAQSFYQLTDKGLTGLTGLIVAKSIITELGPILTAFMITGRVGAAICAQLGTLQVTEQIEALKTMAVDPYRYLVAPRILSGMFAIPLLTIFNMVTGIMGGYLITVYFFGMSSATYFDPIPIHMTIFDLMTGIIKSFVFALIILTVSCFRGITTEGGAAGVGRATTSSVVTSYIWILLSNFVLTVTLNTFRTQTHLIS